MSDGLVWEKYPSKKNAQMFFHRARRKITRLAVIRIFLTKTALDSVEEKVELAIFGVLQQEFCPSPLQSSRQIKNAIISERGPQIVLDPSKFLLPILAQGAQGQLRGLRESIVLAVKLNRTLVIPPFFLDNWIDIETFQPTEGEGDEDDGSDAILTSGFFDIARLADFISLTTIEDFSAACDKKIDAIFQTRRKYCKGMKIERMRTIADDFNIFLARNQSDCENSKISLFPNDSIISKEKRLHIPFSAPSEYFSTSKSCAAFLFPLFNFDFSILSPTEDRRLSDFFEPSSNDPVDKNDIELLEATIASTTRPAYIRKGSNRQKTKLIQFGLHRDYSPAGIADSFIREVFQSPRFIVIHWNFGENEWNFRCSSLHEANQNILEWCKKARMFRKDDKKEPLIESFLNIINEMKIPGNSEKHPVYIAAPQNDDLTDANLIKNILLEKGMRAFSEEDLGNYVEFQFGACQERLK